MPYIAHNIVGISPEFDTLDAAIQWAKSFVFQYETEIRDVENNVSISVNGQQKECS